MLTNMNKQAVLKLNLQVVLFVILCTGRFLIFGQTDTWVQKANYGGGSTFSGIGFSIGDKGYIGLGDNASGTQFQQIWEYDPTTNVWTQKADFGGGTRSNAVAFSIGGKAYVGTGYNSVPQKDFWEYDQTSNTWTQKADFAGGNRIRMVGFSIGTKGYVGTGSNGTFFKDFWEYNPATDTWTALPDFPGLPRQSATGFSIGSKGYIGTGSGTSANFKDFWEYDPSTNTWLQKADVGTTNRYEAVGFSIGSKGYISTGGEWPVYTKDLLEYDPSIDCWAKRADFGGAVRALASGFAVGGKGYVGTSNFTIDFWEYTPAPSLPPPTISSFTPTSGAIGTVVTINGTNFDPASSNNIVTFNGVSALISSASSNTLSVTVPAGATTGSIQVSVGCNTVVSSSNFTVLVPLPTISGFTPSSGTIGATVTITGTNFDPTPANNTVTFNGTTAIVTASTTTSITTFVPLGTTTGTISVTVAGNMATSATDFTVIPAGNNALQFDGINDVVIIPHKATLNFTTQMTMEAWVNLPNPSANQKVFAKSPIGSGYVLGVANGQIYPEIWNPANNGFIAGCMLPNQWTHLAVTFTSGGSMIAYINGIPVQTIPINTNHILANTNNLTIGVASFGFSTAGRIDEVALWNVARTQAEIQADMLGSIPPSSSLVAYYNFNQGETASSNAAVTTLVDNSGNNNNGTLNNFALAGALSNWASGFVAPPPTLVPTITSFSPAFGSVGTTATITGTNFSATPTDNIVRFNGTTAIVTASTTTSITTSVPASATSGPITLAIGCNTATSASNFIVPVCFPANGQNADVVLGQTNFTTNTSGNSNNKFAGVGSIAIHYTTGKVFVADIGNNRILRFSADQANTIGGIAEAVIGQPDFTTTSAGLSQTKLNLPIAIAMDQSSGALWVADANNNRVLRFDDAANIATGAPANGVLGQPGFTTSAATPSATNVGFPWGVVVDSNGDLWVGERAWNRVTKFANAASLVNGAAATVVIGQTNFAATFGGTSTVKLDRPNNVAIDASGNLWVADELNDRVLKFPDAKTLSTGAAATVVLGQLDFFGNSFATAQNRMFGPIGLHADMFGNLWVGDWANHRTLQFVNAALLNNGANASRVLGSPNFTAITSGVTQSITAYIPGLAVDNFGNVFIADDLNRRVVRFNTPTATAPNTSVCSGSVATLPAAGANIIQEYRWYDVPSGGTSLSSSASFVTPPLTTNTTYYVSLFDGGCSYESVRTAVAVSITSAAVAPSTVAASACGPSASLTVSASGGVNSQYRWYTAASGGTALTGEVNDTYTTPAITTTTSYYVSIDDGTCESARTEVIAQIDPLPAAPVVVGASDFAPAILTLKASGGSNGQYRWYTASTGGAALAGEVNDSFTTPSITVATTYYVSINNGQCESARIPVVAGIKINSAPEILSTTASTTVAGRISLPLTTLISDPEDNLDFSTLAITKQPISGARATIDQQYNLDLDYSGISFAGTDRLSISICDELAACSEKELSIEVNGEITVFNALSANGDNKNAVFYLENIETLPDTKENKVTIFNRWGDVVFEVENYDNTDNVFRGINSSGNDLPAGTYFYRIKFASGREEKTGFIALRK